MSDELRYKLPNDKPANDETSTVVASKAARKLRVQREGTQSAWSDSGCRGSSAGRSRFRLDAACCSACGWTRSTGAGSRGRSRSCLRDCLSAASTHGTGSPNKIRICTARTAKMTKAQAVRRTMREIGPFILGFSRRRLGRCGVLRRSLVDHPESVAVEPRGYLVQRQFSGPHRDSARGLLCGWARRLAASGLQRCGISGGALARGAAHTNRPDGAAARMLVVNLTSDQQIFWHHG